MFQWQYLDFVPYSLIDKNLFSKSRINRTILEIAIHKTAWKHENNKIWIRLNRINLSFCVFLNRFRTFIDFPFQWFVATAWLTFIIAFILSLRIYGRCVRAVKTLNWCLYLIFSWFEFIVYRFHNCHLNPTPIKWIETGCSSQSCLLFSTNCNEAVKLIVVKT